MNGLRKPSVGLPACRCTHVCVRGCVRARARYVWACEVGACVCGGCMWVRWVHVCARAHLEPQIVEQRKDTGSRRGRTRSTGHATAERGHTEIDRLGRDVWVGAAGRVVPDLAWGQVLGGGEIGADRRRLPAGHRPVGGETARREAHARLGPRLGVATGWLRAPNGCHVGAGPRSLGHVFALLAWVRVRVGHMGHMALEVAFWGWRSTRARTDNWHPRHRSRRAGRCLVRQPS